MRNAWVSLLVAALVLPRLCSAADAPEPLPQPDDLRQLFKDKEYQALLQKLTRVLTLKGEAARPYDRVELLQLRGEALLQLKQPSGAAEAFDEAVKAVADTTDPTRAANARAMPVLLKRSKAMIYTPRTAPRGETPKPVSLLDVEQRKTAYWLLYNDMKQEMATKVKAGKTATNLGPIVDAIKGLTDFQAVELSATDKDEQAKAMLGDLSARAQTLMKDGIETMTKQTEEIKHSANELLPNLAVSGQLLADTTYHKRGLSFNASRDLKAIIGDCEKVAQAAKDFADLSKVNIDAFTPIADSAERAAAAARRVLEADYNGMFAR